MTISAKQILITAQALLVASFVIGFFVPGFPDNIRWEPVHATTFFLMAIAAYQKRAIPAFLFLLIEGLTLIFGRIDQLFSTRIASIEFLTIAFTIYLPIGILIALKTHKQREGLLAGCLLVSTGLLTIGLGFLGGVERGGL